MEDSIPGRLEGGDKVRRDCGGEAEGLLRWTVVEADADRAIDEALGSHREQFEVRWLFFGHWVRSFGWAWAHGCAAACEAQAVATGGRERASDQSRIDERRDDIVVLVEFFHRVSDRRGGESGPNVGTNLDSLAPTGLRRKDRGRGCTVARLERFGRDGRCSDPAGRAAAGDHVGFQTSARDRGPRVESTVLKFSGGSGPVCS